MKLYVSKTGDKLNKKELNTELISDYICLNPKYKNITIQKKDIYILMDSGAFQDTEKNKRVSFEFALERQLKLEQKIGMISSRIVSYDLIGNKEETILANKFLISKRSLLYPRQLVLMIQGKDEKEYFECLKEVVKIASPEDCVGFGGVALSGRNKDILKKLMFSFENCFEILKEYEIKNVHFFGIGTFKILEKLQSIADNNVYKIELSCDTAGFEIRSTMGNVINEKLKKWEKPYTKLDKYINYHPCDLTRDNVKKAINIIHKIGE